MKIRNGYVSNSSSSSFVMLASTFKQSDISKAIKSLFDFYGISDLNREYLYDVIDGVETNDKYCYYDNIADILSRCNHPKQNSIWVKFGCEENGLESGLGYFIYYSDYSDRYGYYDEKEPDDLNPYIETSKRLQAICEKNSLDLSNIKIIRGTTCEWKE